ncbi:putative transmembrane protein (plasmid) [Rhizobium johnstonii 3841]|uniref:Transmembrane protein n=1 Tax=Rhizobium johnstonii (strain DSM 114642 / LMG 32736 / 3841) TaxID=216596 RepID=Q1M6J8_RHIJ3|nr:putative transmembrane protein [Rhizobium johnstonii 3841]
MYLSHRLLTSSTKPRSRQSRRRFPGLAARRRSEPHGLFRAGTLCPVVVLLAYFFWDVFSESAALRRLGTTAKNYRYAERAHLIGLRLAIYQ